MKDHKGVCAKRRDISENGRWEYIVYPSVKNAARRYEVSRDQGAQFGYEAVLCKCKNGFESRKGDEETRVGGSAKQVYTHNGSRSRIDVGVGSLKTLQKRKVKRIYLPETRDRGVGSSHHYRRTRHNKRNLKTTSSKCVGSFYDLVLEKSPINKFPIHQTKIESTSPDSFLQGASIQKTYAVNQTKSGSTSPIVFLPTSPIPKPKIGNTSPNILPEFSNQTKSPIPHATRGSNSPHVFKPFKQMESMGGDKIYEKQFDTLTKVEYITQPKRENIKKEVKTIEVSIDRSSSKVCGREISKPNALFEKRVSKRAQEAERIFSSESLVQHVHNLENPSVDIPPPLDKLENKYRKLFGDDDPKESKDNDKTEAVLKSASGVRRRFDALRKGLAKKEEAKKVAIGKIESSNVSELSRKNVSVTSDPPSLVERSISNARVCSPDSSMNQKVAFVPKIVTDKKRFGRLEEEEPHGVVGMFRLWGDRFNFEEGRRRQNAAKKGAAKIFQRGKYKKVVSKKPTLPNSPDEEESKKDNKTFFFFKKKGKETSRESYKPSAVTAGRCEVGDGLKIKIGVSNAPNRSTDCREHKNVKQTDSSQYEDMLKKAWLKKFLTQSRESRKSLNIRWKNNSYAKSSSTVFELMENVYRDTGVDFVSRSETSITDSTYSTSYNKQRVNFVQDIEAWMIPKYILDSKNLRKYWSYVIDGENNIDSNYYERKYYGDRNANARRNEIVLRSGNIVNPYESDSSEYLTIDIPKGFISCSSNSFNREAVPSSTEEVYKIVEYESPESNDRLKNLDRLKKLRIKMNMKNNQDLRSILFQTFRNSRKIKKRVAFKSSNDYILKRCYVGVGIITQNDIKSIKPILKIQDDYSDESNHSLYVTHIRRRYADSYLEDYYRHWFSDLDFCSMRLSDTHMQSCSNDSDTSTRNQGDGAKSCPNIYDEFQASTVKVICDGSCEDSDNSGRTNSIQHKLSQIWGKIKTACKSDPINSNARLLPKDSIEVFKKRKIYFNSNRSKWACPDDKPKSQPCTESKATLKPNTKVECCKPTEPVSKPKARKKLVSMLDCDKFLKGIDPVHPRSVVEITSTSKCNTCNRKAPPCPKPTKTAPTQTKRPSIACFTPPTLPPPCSTPQGLPSPPLKSNLSQKQCSPCDEQNQSIKKKPTEPCSPKKSPVQSPEQTSSTDRCPILNNLRKKLSPRKLKQSGSKSSLACTSATKLKSSLKKRTCSGPCKPCCPSSVGAGVQVPSPQKTPSPCKSPPKKSARRKASPPTTKSPTKCSSLTSQTSSCPTLAPPKARKSPLKKTPVHSPTSSSFNLSTSCECKPLSPEQKPATPCSPSSSETKIVSPKCSDSEVSRPPPQKLKCTCKKTKPSKVKSSKVCPPKQTLKPPCTKQLPKICPDNQVAEPQCKKPPSKDCSEMRKIDSPCTTCKKKDSQIFPWPLKNQVSNQPSLQSICSECKSPTPKLSQCEIKPEKLCDKCPSKQSVKCVSPPRRAGISIKVRPVIKCGSKESSNALSKTLIKCPAHNTNSEDNIILNIKKESPSTEEIRDGVNIKVTDFDGNTLYERKDYNTNKIKQKPQVLNNMYKDLASDPKLVQHAELQDSSSDTNLIEISLKLKLTQGDKTTEINFGNEANEQVFRNETKNQNKQTSQEVFFLKDEAEQCDEDNNDININITIKNFKPKLNPKCCYGEKFSHNITEKFHNVSTDYRELLLKKSDNNDLCIQKVDFSSSNAGFKYIANDNEVNYHKHGESDFKITSRSCTEKSAEQSESRISNKAISDMETEFETFNKKIEEIKDSCIPKSVSGSRECKIICDVNKQEFNKKEEEVYSLSEQSVGPIVSESVDRIVTTPTPLTRDEKKSFLKKIFAKASKVRKSKNKDKIKQFKEILRLILTDNGDQEINVTSNELVKEMTYASLKPNYFRDTESINNYYKALGNVVASKEEGKVEPNDDGVSQNSDDESEGSSCDDEKNGKCLCSQFAARLNICSPGGGCLCGQKRKVDEHTFCDLRTADELLLLNYNAIGCVDAETQNSKFSCNSTKVSVHSKAVSGSLISNLEIIGFNSENTMVREDDFDKQIHIYSNRANNKKHGERKRNVNVVQEMVNERKCILSNATNIRMIDRDSKGNICLESNKHKNKVVKCKRPVDILQSDATKKAVLEIYAKKTYSNEGERIVAKLPKFSYDKERDIKNYSRRTTNAYRSLKTEFFMMSLANNCL